MVIGLQRKLELGRLLLKNDTILNRVLAQKINTTNQRMELKAIIEALKFCKKQLLRNEVKVEIFSDSAYCVNGMNQKWYDKWILNKWTNSKKET
ncbi:Rnase H [Staphylococcus phage S-CoN_Ph11]|nr:Rnase H [Staphylococcus phage S-CoN_Ph11]